MQDWATYSLNDFVLFSPQVYFRLFELHNQALWPAQLLTTALCLAVFLRLLKPSPRGIKQALALYGVLWLWMAVAFFWQRYASINWTSIYIAPFALLQGLFLLTAALMRQKPAERRTKQTTDALPLGLYLAALFGYPLFGMMMGRPLVGLEYLGLAPDPTAIATLAVTAMLPSPCKWLLMVIPLLWCLITGLTLYALNVSGFFIAPLAAVCAIFATIQCGQIRLKSAQ